MSEIVNKKSDLAKRQAEMKAEVLRNGADRRKKRESPPLRKLKSYSILDMQRIAAEHRGECLAETYINGEFPMEWLCSRGHLFSAAPKTIIRGHWCPVCGREMSSQIRKFPFTDIQRILKQKGCVIVAVPEGYRNKYSMLQIRSTIQDCECKASVRTVRSNSCCSSRSVRHWLHENIPSPADGSADGDGDEPSQMDVSSRAGAPPR